MVSAARQLEKDRITADVAGHTAVLSNLAPMVPESIVLSAIDLLKLARDDQAKAPFVARALRAIADLAKTSSKRSLLDAASAPSDTMALLDALDNPELLSEIGEADPLIASRVRGAVAQRWLLNQEGGVCSAAELGSLLGHLSRQAIDKRRKQGKLVALHLGRHGYRYPVWQVHNGAVLPGLESVIAALHESDPWTQIGFMLSPSSWLGGKTPLAELRRGEVERVLATAEMFAE